GVALAAGLIVNTGLGLRVWDYSKMPLNLMGQVCLPYSLLWFGLTLPAMALCRLCGRAQEADA
ncbi:MAG: putative ABC transporter permease, partial [Acutalibacter sp.]|nr:putative ABC transporter permease [Acutalibacter sp.]